MEVKRPRLLAILEGWGQLTTLDPVNSRVAEMVSAAPYVEDVDAGLIVLFDGPTKNSRYTRVALHLHRWPAPVSALPNT